jgi:hypothetical protein
MAGNRFVFKPMFVLSKLTILSSFDLKINTFVFKLIHYHDYFLKYKGWQAGRHCELHEWQYISGCY